MKRVGFVLASFGLLVIAGCGSQRGESVTSVNFNASKYEKVAIVDVAGAVYGEGIKGQISDLFTMELVRKGYSVIERARIQKLIEEQKF